MTPVEGGKVDAMISTFRWVTSSARHGAVKNTELGWRYLTTAFLPQRVTQRSYQQSERLSLALRVPTRSAVHIS